MLKEKLKGGHAVITFGIVCVCVTVGLLTLTFCVDPIRGDASYVFESSVSVSEAYELTPNVPGASIYYNYFEYIAFNDIGYYETLNWIRVSTIPGFRRTGENYSNGCLFYATIGADIIGNGSLTYWKSGPDAEDWSVLYYFEDFDRGSYNGYQNLKINPIGDAGWGEIDDIDCMRGNEVHDMTEAYHVQLNYDVWNVFLGQLGQEYPDYLIQFGGYFENHVNITTFGIGENIVNVTAVVGGKPYRASWNVSTAIYTYFNLSDNIVNNSFPVMEEPIYIECWDYLGYYHYEIYGEAPPAISQLYGYVFDAADNFGIEDAFVEFQDQSTTTSDTGFYLFNSDTFGDSWLNISKTGYQNTNLTFDYQGSTHLDVYMVANETVNPGTCTVSGVVYDSDLHPIDDAYVKIFNDTFSTYIYTSSSGYFVFYDLTNTTYSLSAEHPDYIKQQKSINLTVLDTAYYYTFTLLGEGVTPGITPTPTPTVAPDMIDAIDVWWDILGLLEWKGLVYAMIVIGGLGMALGVVSGGNGWVAAIGAFFGFVLSVAFGWIPIWVVALGLIGAAIIMVKVLGSDNR